MGGCPGRGCWHFPGRWHFPQDLVQGGLVQLLSLSPRPSLDPVRLDPQEEIGGLGRWEEKSDTARPEDGSCAPCNPSPHRVSYQHRGDLGNVRADADGRAVFRIEDEQLKVSWEEGGALPNQTVGLRLLSPLKGVGRDWSQPGCRRGRR